MLEIITKIPLFKVYRQFGWPRMLPINFTISLTYACNSRCKTCRIYTRKTENLSFGDYEKLFLSIGRSPYWITFSGGEPFLREDIADICIQACRICKPKIINIPTNGILSDRIEKQVNRILESCPNTKVIINLSVDAIGDRHDEIRGSKDSFERVMETYKRLRGIGRKR